MSQYDFSIDDTVPKHKKKSKKGGTSRANHKHDYKTVLLTKYYEYTPGKKSKSVSPAKVCSICGRVGEVDFFQYELVDKTDQTYPFAMKERRIRDPETLEKWHCDFFDKFAKKTEAI